MTWRGRAAVAARAHGTGVRTPDVVAGMLLAIGAAQAADAITFVRMLRDEGLAAEANPFVAHLAGMGSFAPLVLLKALLIVEVVCVVVVIGRRFPFVAGLVATLAVVAGLVGAYSNLAVIVGWRLG